MIRIAHGHKFGPHLPVRVKAAHTDAAYKDRIVNDLSVTEQLPKLLLEKVAHRSTCLFLFFAFEGSDCPACGANSSLEASRMTERFWPLMTRVSSVSF